jgi:UDP-N-acetylglucosamine 2-epimerase (non-hydrolysing)
MEYMKKILLIFGTRPEAVKMVPVIKELENHTHLFNHIVCVTAQHRDMLDQVLSVFSVRPNYDLNIMQYNQDLFDVTKLAITKIKTILEIEKPDIVLVQGDTTSAMIASLSAFYKKISIGHIEAGLRTGNKYAPFPEEINRKIISTMADVHFAPTDVAKNNLINEGIPSDIIFVTGNTVIDCLLMSLSLIKDKIGNDICNKLIQKYPRLKSVLNQKHESKNNNKFILITGHRRENVGHRFENILKAMLEIAIKYPDIFIIFPVHSNPKIRTAIKKISDIENRPNIILIEPLEYFQFIYLMSQSYLILTDSGGIQEEAPSLGKPVLVMRDVTERPEAVKIGAVRLVGTEVQSIVKNLDVLLQNDSVYQSMSNKTNPYGDGQAAKRIVNVCKNL